MWRRWEFTVCGDMNNVSAISRLVLDGVLGELLVADSGRDPYQLGIIGYLEGEQGEQLQTIVMPGDAEPVVCLVGFANRHRM
jgi:hypothetical protein